MTEHDIARAMEAKGYRYIISFPDGKPQPLYTKNLGLRPLTEDGGAIQVVKTYDIPGTLCQTISSYLEGSRS